MDSKDYRKEWFEKSKIDYVPPFISLWFSFNSWYKYFYSELEKNTDRDYINKLKSDFSGRNMIYKKFKKLLVEKLDKESLQFKSNLEFLIYSLNNANLKNENLKFKISFEHVLKDFRNKDDINEYYNIIENPSLKKNGSLTKKYEGNVIKLDEKYIVNDIKLVFSGLIENIYQVRHLLIHGNMNPDPVNLEVIKYSYLILYDLMNF